MGEVQWLLWLLFWALQLSWLVPADADCQCDKAAVLSVTIQERSVQWLYKWACVITVLHLIVAEVMHCNSNGLHTEWSQGCFNYYCSALALCLNTIEGDICMLILLAASKQQQQQQQQ